MSTNNPFEKLSVKIDKEEDEQGEFEQVKSKEKNVPFGIETKKRKVRPKEKAEEGGEEGFQEVKNRGPKRRPPQEGEEEEGKGKDHAKRRGINYHTTEEREYRENKRPPRGRKFDRQSGTGRGKEIAKGGAGGKYTWDDNPKKVARDFENNNDDYYFEEALNTENKEKRERQQRRRRDDDENNKENGGEGEKEGEEGRKKGFQKEEKKPYELKEEEKLKKPEGAISLEEYLNKQAKPKEEEQKEVKRIKDGAPLNKIQENKDKDILGANTQVKKKTKKKKEKEVNQQELELNAKIGANLEIGESFERGPRRGGRGRGRGGRGRGGKGRGGRGYENDGKKFVYNPDDFPEFN